MWSSAKSKFQGEKNSSSLLLLFLLPLPHPRKATQLRKFPAIVRAKIVQIVCYHWNWCLEIFVAGIYLSGSRWCIWPHNNTNNAASITVAKWQSQRAGSWPLIQNHGLCLKKTWIEAFRRPIDNIVTFGKKVLLLQSNLLTLFSTSSFLVN